MLVPSLSPKHKNKALHPLILAAFIIGLNSLIPNDISIVDYVYTI